MTQIEPIPDSPAERIDPFSNRPKDSKPATDSAPIQVNSDQYIAADAQINDKDVPVSFAVDDSNANYRPPEAVQASKSNLPAVLGDTWTADTTNNAWTQDHKNSVWGDNAQDWNTPDYQKWGETLPNADQWKNLSVIGTDENLKDDSERWWDPDVQRTKRNPGPGMLAPRVIDTMHDSDHVLYEVTISGNPTVELPAALSPKTSITAAGALNSSAGTSVPAALTPTTSISTGEAASASEEPTSAAAEPHVPPTFEELRDATPHPAALYCRRHHGWVIISVTTASATPSHLSAHWCSDPEKKALLSKLPDSSLRTEKDCIDPDAGAVTSSYPTWNWSASSGQKLHHLHRYPNVVAGSGLFPALKRQSLLSAVQPANAAPKSSEDVEMGSETQSPQNQVQDDEPRSSWEHAPLSEHLDLYLCCQCKTQILCSPGGSVLPGIIPADALEKYIQERVANPKPGQTREQSALASLEMILRLGFYYTHIVCMSL
jgi:ubiquitin carboxyl-terminal hydrolase 25/28